MNKFEITDFKKLSDLKEDVITIKKIISDDISNLTQLVLMLNIETPDGVKTMLRVPVYDKDLIYSKKPELSIAYKITDCSNSTLEVHSPKGKKFIIQYETIADRIRHIKEKEEKSRTNIKSEVTKWQNSVKLLFENISSWISPYGDVFEIIKSDILISEEIAGQYSIPMLVIKPTYGKSITLKPVGTYILGAEGRIDIYIQNYGKQLMLILGRIDKTDKWHLVTDKDIKTSIEFTKAQFISLIDDIIPA